MNVDPTFQDVRLWALSLLGLVWLYRAWRSLKTLQHAPIIEPTSFVGAGSSRPNAQRQIQGAETAPLLSVIIPAKNEENNIRTCVDRLLVQNYPNYEIIVANDNSADKTEEILKNYGDKIKTFNVRPTPKGWTGKNYALHEAITHARGEIYLFTDADTRHEPSSLSSAMSQIEKDNLDFLSLLPKCITESLVEKILQPLAMAFLGLWFPIEKINDPKSTTYFANGQYLMIKKKLYKAIGGHKAVKEEFLEDFALARASKQHGARTQCGFGMKIYGTRMYDSFASLWRGWRRIYLHAFKRKPAPILIRTLSVFFFSVIPFTAFLALSMQVIQDPVANGLLWKILGLLLIFILGISWKGFLFVKANPIYSLLHPVASIIVAMILLDAFYMAITKKQTVWR